MELSKEYLDLVKQLLLKGRNKEVNEDVDRADTSCHNNNNIQRV